MTVLSPYWYSSGYWPKFINLNIDTVIIAFGWGEMKCRSRVVSFQVVCSLRSAVHVFAGWSR